MFVVSNLENFGKLCRTNYKIRIYTLYIRVTVFKERSVDAVKIFDLAIITSIYVLGARVFCISYVVLDKVEFFGGYLRIYSAPYESNLLLHEFSWFSIRSVSSANRYDIFYYARRNSSLFKLSAQENPKRIGEESETMRRMSLFAREERIGGNFRYCMRVKKVRQTPCDALLLRNFEFQIPR